MFMYTLLSINSKHERSLLADSDCLKWHNIGITTGNSQSQPHGYYFTGMKRGCSAIHGNIDLPKPRRGGRRSGNMSDCTSKRLAAFFHGDHLLYMQPVPHTTGHRQTQRRAS